MAGRKKHDVSAPPKKPPRPRAITKADLDAAIAPLATKAELAKSLENHPTHEQHRAAIDAAINTAVAPLATKAELAKALENHPTHDQLRAAIDAAVAPLARREDHPTHEQHRTAIIEALQPYPTKIEVNAMFDAFAHRFREVMYRDMERLMETTMERSIARHIGAAMEEMRGWIRALDEKYSDLPARVSAIEARLDGNNK